MACIAYIPKNFRPESQRRIAQANLIIEEYAEQGFALTLRQLYYQFVSRAWLPNTMRSYKSLGSLINDARLAGEIDWLAIEDRTRNLQSNSHWDSPADVVEACAQQFRIDMWAEQEYRIEVWIEKDALLGVIERVCRDLDVPYFSCRGYVSQSEMWQAAQRLGGYALAGQTPIILHLGDHDPSGIDMTRDISDRVMMLGSDLDTNLTVEVHRIALTMDQIDEHEPPANPAKTTDSRFDRYIARYGPDSWELDALDPPTLAALIQSEVEARRDYDVWREAVQVQRARRRQLRDVAERWEELVGGIEDE
jgi:hypothetical protein